MIPIKLPKESNNSSTDAAPSVMPAYNGRVLAYLTSSITISVGILENHFQSYMVWFIPAAMLWPHLLYFVIRYLKLDQKPATREHTLLLDGVIVGVTIILIDFSLTVTIFNILMACFSFIVDSAAT